MSRAGRTGWSYRAHSRLARGPGGGQPRAARVRTKHRSQAGCVGEAWLGGGPAERLARGVSPSTGGVRSPAGSAADRWRWKLAKRGGQTGLAAANRWLTVVASSRSRSLPPLDARTPRARPRCVSVPTRHADATRCANKRAI